ncbi:MAG: hypothetical protein M3N82_14820 [Pseudomonadota bacterium]|nr:hypothetical protein [Pseudomonadota bacterium]
MFRNAPSSVLRLALAASAALACCAASAQKAALVQEVYGPGRTPYQSNQLYNPSASICPNQFYCQIAFPAVPAGKRLVVTQASATYSMNAGATEAIVSIGNSLFSTMDLPAPVNVGNSRYVASSAITYYFEPGETPYVFITGGSVVTNNTGHASLVGYLVPAP